VEVETNDATVPLCLVVTGPSGGITGLAPTVGVRLVASGSPQYLDWGSGTFKTAGWATKYQAMTEGERGCYQATLNVAALSLANGQKLVAEYFVSSPPTVQGEDAEVIVLTDVRAKADLLRKAMTNRLEQVSGNPGTLTLYDDDGATRLLQWPVRDENGNSVLAAPGQPARRGAGA
jgi:hypothetical protein